MVAVEILDNKLQTITATKTQMFTSLFVAMAVLVGFFCGSVVFMSRSYGPESMALRLQSLSASNFNVTNSPLLAEWNAELDVGNRKDHLKIDVDEIQGLLYYKDHEISCGVVLKPLKILSNKQRTVNLHFNRMACGAEQPFLDDDLLGQLVEERRRGRIRLSLKLEMEMVFDLLRSSWSWQRTMKPSCPEVDVVFDVGNGVGRLASDIQLPITCTG